MSNKTIKTNMFIIICGLCAFLSISQAETTLSQVEYDLLKVRLSDQLKKEKFEDAISSIGQIKASGYEYSPTLLYFEGFALQQSGQLSTAKSAYLNYLETAGSEGKYYQKSLQNIVAIDDQLEEMLQQYTKLLASSSTESPEVISLEKALGPSAAAAREKYEIQKQEAMLAEKARLAEEQKRALLEKEKRAKGSWEKTFSEKGYIQDVVILPNQDIFAVGHLELPKCGNKQNSWTGWIMRLDISGDELINENACTTSNNFNTSTGFFDIAFGQNAEIFTLGRAEVNKDEVGSIYRIHDSGTEGWQTFKARPKGQKKSDDFGAYYGLHITRSNNILAVGTFDDGSAKSMGHIDMYADTGKKIWSYQADKTALGSSFYNVAELSDGRILAVGGHKTAVEPILDGQHFITYHSQFMQVLTAEGKLDLTFKDSKDEHAFNQFSDAVPTSDGGAIIAGFKNDSKDKHFTTQVFRIDAKLNHIWDKTYTSDGNTLARSIISHGNGYVVVGETTIEGLGEQGWILKVDGQGNTIWDRHHGEKADDAFDSISALPNNGGFIVTGSKDELPWILKLDAQGRFSP